MRRPTDSKDRVTIHIRYKNANNASGKTLCGEWVYDQLIRQYLGKPVTVRSSAVPADLRTELTTPQLFSVGVRYAGQLDEPDKYLSWSPPSITVSPYCPPIRYWDFCEGCWDHHYRTFKKLADTEL